MTLKLDGITVLSCRGNIALCMVPVDLPRCLLRSRRYINADCPQDPYPYGSWAVKSVGLDEVPARGRTRTAPYRGEGVIAAVVDQGVDPTTVAF